MGRVNTNTNGDCLEAPLVWDVLASEERFDRLKYLPASWVNEKKREKKNTFVLLKFYGCTFIHGTPHTHIVHYVLYFYVPLRIVRSSDGCSPETEKHKNKSVGMYVYISRNNCEYL